MSWVWLFASIGIVLIAVLSRTIWKDPLTRKMLVGLGLIIVGVLLIKLT